MAASDADKGAVSDMPDLCTLLKRRHPVSCIPLILVLHSLTQTFGMWGAVVCLVCGELI